MWQQLLGILADIPKPGEDVQWHKLWPMLILAVLYALSGWIKNKQSKKSPPPSQPTPTPPRQQTRSLPSYARKRVAHKPTQQPSKPTQQPSRPIPTIERPVPTARRPAGPQVTRRPSPTPTPPLPAVLLSPVEILLYRVAVWRLVVILEMLVGILLIILPCKGWIAVTPN